MTERAGNGAQRILLVSEPHRSVCSESEHPPICAPRPVSSASVFFASGIASAAEIGRIARLATGAFRTRLMHGAVLLQLCIVLSGCDQRAEILTDLDTRQSIEVGVALYRTGIQAARERSSKGRDERYSIYVSQSDYPRALQVLHEYRLPGDRLQSIDELTEPKGFVPNGRELTNVRLDHALSLSIERLLSALPGVVEVRAVVRSNLISGYEDGRQSGGSPSASVVVRYQSPSGVLPFSLEEAKEIVRKAVPGSSPDAISITTTRVILSGDFIPEGVPDPSAIGVPLSSLAPFLFKVSPGEQQRALRQVLIFVIVSTLAGGVIGLWIGLRGSRRRRAAKSSRGAKSKSFFLETTYRGEEERTNAPAVQSGARTVPTGPLTGPKDLTGKTE